MGGSADSSFLSFVGGNYFATGYTSLDSTPGNAYLNSALSAITQSTVTGADFSVGTYQYIDGNLRVFSDAQIIELAKILKLTLPDRPAQTIASAPDPIPLEDGTSGNAQGVPEAVNCFRCSSGARRSTPARSQRDEAEERLRLHL